MGRVQYPSTGTLCNQFFCFWNFFQVCSYIFGRREELNFYAVTVFVPGGIIYLRSYSFGAGENYLFMIYSFCVRGFVMSVSDWLDIICRHPVFLHLSTDHHGDLQGMWCRMGIVTKSSPVLCLTTVIKCPLLRLRCCCCCAAVGVLLLSSSLCACVLLSVRVRGEIVRFVRRRTTANAFAKDVFIDQERGLGE